MSKIMDAVKKYKYAFAIWTDRADFIIDKDGGIDEEKLLEIRCFDKDGEFYAHRDVADEPFVMREITSGYDCPEKNVYFEGTYADDRYDEAQYLDIDNDKTKRAGNGLTYATGGGSYHLPDDAKNKRLIIVRVFYNYDREGVARKFDWRLVEFTDEEMGPGRSEN